VTGLRESCYIFSSPTFAWYKPMTIDTKVTEHYTRGKLVDAILQAITQSGKDVASLGFADLAPVDELHVGGLEATQAVAAQMQLHPGLRLLDVGSGIGGPARYFAAEHNCNVVGIDLTEEFVQVATSLTRIVKLEHLAEFRQASALEIPFASGTFDRAYMMHVGMNIADKAGVFREVRRVLKTDGIFAVFDIVRTGVNGTLRYPVPWALNQETSFVSEIKDYREALESAGFRIAQLRNRREFAIDFMKKSMSRMGPSGPPVLGIQLLMGDKAQEMLKNVLLLMEENVLEPVELYAQAEAQATR
jgi:ubiquinone/menaquinone biosynthesis C-methylase UbiE